jgi:hypothetical protein
MSILFLFVFGLLLWIFLIKPILTIKNAHDALRDRFNQARGAQQQQQRGYRSQSEQDEAARNKKIDHTVGEYVEFTEVDEPTAPPTSDTGSKLSAEDRMRRMRANQVEDAEWVDE